MKNLVILGSTGSIGTQALDIVDRNGDALSVTALAAGSNVSLMEEQIRRYHPKMACLFNEQAAGDLKVRVADTNVKVTGGMDGLLEELQLPEADMVLNSVVGMIGIRPTLAAIRAGKDIALANKETLVTAGHLIMPAVKEAGVKLLPVDSEHSAIFQCMNGENRERVRRILLTCSGGTFRGKTKEEIARMRVADALKNPNWDMGSKVTIDSATLVNKGLEVMEARWLFDVSVDDICVVVQPQSIIHSMVEYEDGSVMAHLASPDMRLPIQYAFFWPDRRPLEIRPLDLFALGSLQFEKPDTDTFLGLPLAYRAAHAGGSMPTVFNAANEEAVAAFMKGRIGIPQLYDLIAAAMDRHSLIRNPDLDEILDAETWARQTVRSLIG